VCVFVAHHGAYRAAAKKHGIFLCADDGFARARTPNRARAAAKLSTHAAAAAAAAAFTKKKE
jgi:hypothetical protein